MSLQSTDAHIADVLRTVRRQMEADLTPAEYLADELELVREELARMVQTWRKSAEAAPTDPGYGEMGEMVGFGLSALADAVERAAAPHVHHLATLSPAEAA